MSKFLPNAFQVRMMQFMARGCGIEAGSALTLTQRRQMDELVEHGLAKMSRNHSRDKVGCYAMPDTVPPAPPPGCELDRIAREGVCGRPAKFVWTHRTGKMFICDRCAPTVQANHGQLDPIPAAEHAPTV